MESKKTNRANLESKKVIFLQIGLILALSLCLLAFEWRTYDRLIVLKPASGWSEVDELLPINTDQHKLPPPPPAVKPVYTINIVENTDIVPDDQPGFDVSFSEDWQNPDIIPLPEEVSNAAEDTVYSQHSIEKQPEFPGGEAALYEYLRENIKYPRMAVEVGIQGTVYIGFVIEKDGKLSNIRVERSPDKLLADEALRVVSAMPAWSAGKQSGMPVRVSFYLPVKFKLQ
jgi:periplasmic protein TonB